jgi:16S rRNA G966 N2-methylase RsmD
MRDVGKAIKDDAIDVGLWTEKMFRFLRVAGFSYPYCPYDTIVSAIKAVRNSTLNLNEDIPSGYSQGSSECLSFFHGFWNANRKGKKSPVEAFENDDILRHAISDCIVYRKSVSDSAIRAEIGTFGGVHNFRPIVAKSVIDMYCPSRGSILDPCAGWGGRLFGFYCSRASRYVGIDAEKKTVDGLKRLGEKLKNAVSEKNHDIFHDAFEDWNTDERFDVVFTSPPYFDAENYGQDERQSIIRYPEYGAWKHKFLFRLVEKAMLFLKDGGVLVLNVSNTKDYSIEDDLALYLAQNYKIEKIHHMILSSLYGNKSRSEPLFVVRKVAAAHKLVAA